MSPRGVENFSFFSYADKDLILFYKYVVIRKQIKWGH